MEFVSAGEGTAVAGTRDQMVHGFLFFHAEFGDGIAFGFLGVDSRIVVDLILRVAADFRDSLDIGHKGSVGSLEIVVRKRILARPEFLLSPPTLHEVFLQKGATGSVVKTHFVLDGAVLVHLRLVGKDQLMRILIVLEEIENAGLLHQAGDKVESGFAILDHILALWIAGLRAVLEILKAVVLEDFLNDFGDGFLLKNLAVGCAREEPQPRNNFGMVVTETVVAAGASETTDEAIPMALVAVSGVLDMKGNLFAHDISKGDGMILRKKVYRKTKKLGYSLVAAEAAQEQRVFP